MKALWQEIKNDPRTRQWKDGRGLNGKEMYRILLGKLMPWELIPGFQAWNPDIMKIDLKKSEYADGRSDRLSARSASYRSQSWSKGPNHRFSRQPRRYYDIDLDLLAKTLKDWKFEIIGFVGYERCVITAGGISTDEVMPKTMEYQASNQASTFAARFSIWTAIPAATISSAPSPPATLPASQRPSL